MGPVEVDIKDVLEDASIGTFADTDDWGIFIGAMPDMPDNCISIIVTGEEPASMYYSRTVGDTYYPVFQILVRGLVFTTTYAKAMAIHTALNKKHHWTTDDGTFYGTVTARHQPIPIGQDDKKRFRFTLNFRTLREVEK